MIEGNYAFKYSKLVGVPNLLCSAMDDLSRGKYFAIISDGADDSQVQIGSVVSFFLRMCSCVLYHQKFQNEKTSMDSKSSFVRGDNIL